MVSKAKKILPHPQPGNDHERISGIADIVFLKIVNFGDFDEFLQLRLCLADIITGKNMGLENGEMVFQIL